MAKDKKNKAVEQDFALRMNKNTSSVSRKYTRVTRLDAHRSKDRKFAGRSQFIENLYQNYSGELIGWLRRRFGEGPPEPHDIAQTAFEKISALEDYERIENPKAFLFATAINTAMSSVQHIVRARRFFNAELQNVGHQVEQITPECVLKDKRRLETINEAIAKLPAKQREILIRSRIQGETYVEIRTATGWSKAAISRQLNAALATLQKTLDAVEDAQDTDLEAGRK